MHGVSISFMQGWGKTIILGVEMHGAPLCVSSHEILHGKSVVGSMFGGLKPKQDIPILADKYLNKVQLASDIPSIVSPLTPVLALYCMHFSWHFVAAIIFLDLPLSRSWSLTSS